MLVENKFYYISLPRCASTAFHMSCLKQNLSVTTLEKEVDEFYAKQDFSNIVLEELIKDAPHMHESLVHLENRYGNQYDIISVKRDKHDRFYSLWKHVLNEVKKYYGEEVHNKLKTLKINNILNFPANTDLQNFDIVNGLAKSFLEGLDIKYNWYLQNCIVNMYTPTSVWHNNDPRIIWFDFNKLYELEEWVSNKIGKSFKLEKINSSIDSECDLKLDGDLIKEYNIIFDRYDIQKTKKSII